MTRHVAVALLLVAGCSFDLEALRGSARSDAGEPGEHDGGTIDDAGDPADARAPDAATGPDGCVATPAGVSGGFPGMVVRNVTASGGSIALTDSFAGVTGTIELGAGVTASGAFVPCMTSGSPCDSLNAVSASGSTVTFTSAGVMGGPMTMGAITLVGATAVGSMTATPFSPTVAGYFRSVSTSGGTITFTDQAGNSGALALTTTVGCP